MKKEPLLSPKFALALQFANETHSTQKRKSRGAPYISHLLAVCSFVLEYGGTEEQAIAALLHDAAEDQGGQPMLDSISVMFGKKVADIVAACTDSVATDPNKKEEWLPRKTRYLKHLAKEPGEAKFVSCADKLHNISNTLRDIRGEGADVWNEQAENTKNSSAAKQCWYYLRCLKALSNGWESPIRQEFAHAVVQLCELVGSADDVAKARKLAGGK